MGVGVWGEMRARRRGKRGADGGEELLERKGKGSPSARGSGSETGVEREGKA